VADDLRHATVQRRPWDSRMHAHTTRGFPTRQAVSAPPPLAPRATLRVQRRRAVAAAHPCPPSSPPAPGVCPHTALYRGGWWCAAPTRRTRLYALWTLFVLVVLASATTAVAQVVRPFTQRFATNVAGDISLIGNTLMSCRRPGVTGCKGNNNSYDMVHVQDTPDATVLNRSTAALTLPVGATVAWAGLYWGGRTRTDPRAPPPAPQESVRTPSHPPVPR
jgi:hypothetical protein